MTNNITLPFETIMAALFPSPEIKTVEQYQEFLRNIIMNASQQVVDRQPKRGPGRPLKYIHPAYEEPVYRKIKEYIQKEIEAYPEAYDNPKGLSSEQPNEATDFYLDNGVILRYNKPIYTKEDGNIVLPAFPPVNGGTWK